VSGLAAFGWGCLGGVVAYLLTIALPEAKAMFREGTWNPTKWRLVGAGSLFVIYVALGGAAAAWLHESATTAKDAVSYGLGAEAILGGVLRTTLA
jgi:hypothetical protein